MPDTSYTPVGKTIKEDFLKYLQTMTITDAQVLNDCQMTFAAGAVSALAILTQRINAIPAEEVEKQSNPMDLLLEEVRELSEQASYNQKKVHEQKQVAYAIINLFRDPPGRHCKPRLVKLSTASIIFVDAGNHSKVPTITNDVEWFIQQLRPFRDGRRIIYYDSHGIPTEVLIENDRFKTYTSISEEELKKI